MNARPYRWSIALGVVAAAAALAAAGSTAGIGISPDSARYLSVASSLREGRGFAIWTGAPVTLWPPLYPVLISAFEVLGVEGSGAARLLNVVLFAGLCGGVCVWLMRRLSSPAVAAAATLGVILAPTLVHLTLWAWSELVFICLCVTSLFTVERAIRSGKLGPVWWGAVLAGGAALTRYTGVALIAACCLALLLLPRRSWMARLRASVSFGLISSAPLALWFARNWVRDGTLMGPRPPSLLSFGFNVGRLAMQPLEWLLPPLREGAVQPVIFGLLAAGLAAWSWTAWRQAGATSPDGPGGSAPADAPVPPSPGGVRSTRSEREMASGSWSELLLPVLPFLFYGAAHFLLLLYSSTTVYLEVITSRYTAPVYVPALLFAAVAADRLVARVGARSTALLGLGVPVLGLWLALAIPVDWRLLESGRAGLGYASPEWRASPLVAYLREHPPSGTVFSNAEAALYVLAGIGAERGPTRPLDGGPGPTADVARFREALASGEPVHLVWFKERVAGYYLGWDELDRLAELQLVSEQDDGVLLRAR
jgi:hypothetical protein